MSDQLAALASSYLQGYGAEQLDLDPDIVVVGCMSAAPVIEALLDRRHGYNLGAAGGSRSTFSGSPVLAVAGTHGKNHHASMLAWILEHAGLEPDSDRRVPSNFDATARLGGAVGAGRGARRRGPGAGAPRAFRDRGDEYDTRSSTSAPSSCITAANADLNNLEYDNADIYPDIAAIRWQFAQLLRTVPGSGCIVRNGATPRSKPRSLKAAGRLARASGCGRPMSERDACAG